MRRAFPATSSCSVNVRQIRLARTRKALVECPLTADGYLKAMLDSKHLSVEETGSNIPLLQ
jgi:hypothetical protein